MEISINKSNYLKGIAIILMLIHHLFAYPSRISPDITVYHMVNSVDIEMFVGLFGKICVSMFLFLSGYGFSLKKEVSFKYIWGKLKNLYISYWIVLFIFVPIGIIFFPGERYSLSPSLFLENLMGIKSTYNSEWWFFKLYVLYVLSLPLLSRLNIGPLLGLLFLAALCGKGLQYVAWAPEVLIEYCTWLLPFGFGMVFGRSQKMPPKLVAGETDCDPESYPSADLADGDGGGIYRRAQSWAAAGDAAVYYCADEYGRWVGQLGEPGGRRVGQAFDVYVADPQLLLLLLHPEADLCAALYAADPAAVNCGVVPDQPGAEPD